MTATLRRSAPVYEVWRRVLGTDTLPVREWPERGHLGEYYRLDVEALTSEQRARLNRYLSGHWKLAGDVVARILADPAHGVPVLASDIVVSGELFT